MFDDWPAEDRDLALRILDRAEQTAAARAALGEPSGFGAGEQAALIERIFGRRP